MRSPIPVSKPFLPPREELDQWLAKIWESGVLSNHGPLLRELESRLRERLGAPHLSVIANGTLALQLGIRATRMRGRVLTTPFSFAATTTALLWENCEPVFVDVDPDTLNVDPAAVAARLDERVGGMLFTHVYGNPCDVVTLAALGSKCPILYDAAHAFGVTVVGAPITSFGDASALSFHATKVFHTGEGGALALRDAGQLAHVERMQNFGQSSPGVFVEVGTNAKASELHAALGLAVLAHLDEILARRAVVSRMYDGLLEPAAHLFRKPQWHRGASRNHAYYPLICQSEEALLRMVKSLADVDVQARRYFFPSLSTLPYVTAAHTPVSDDAARRVACIPLHTSISDDDVARIAETVVRALKSASR